MAWTATLRSKRQESNGVYLYVQFTDGTRIIDKEYLVNGESVDYIRRKIKNDAINLDNNDLINTEFVEGIIAEPTITQTPTQAELDANQWLSDYNKWVNVKTKLIDTGIITGNETAAVALKTKVQTNFKPAYLNLL